jgi:hypothetical protein
MARQRSMRNARAVDSAYAVCIMVVIRCPSLVILTPSEAEESSGSDE